MNLRFPVLVAAALAIATHSQLTASAWAQAQSPRDWPSPPSDPLQGGRGGSTFSLDTLFNALKIAPDEASAWADRLLAKSPTALRNLKHSFNANSASVTGFLPYDALEAYRATEEAREGTLAFAEKREPDFSRWR